MLRLARSLQKSKKSITIVLAVLIISLTGLGLWADIPGAKPDHKVKVTKFSPQGTTDRTTNITISFSNDLVHKDSVNRPTTDIPVIIKPDIAGLARWTAPNVLTIYPGRKLNPATKYQAVVKAGGGYINGNAIKRDEEFSFNTRPFSIQVSRAKAQRDRTKHLKARLFIDLAFNYPVDRKQLQEEIKILGRDGATKSKLLIIWPDTALDGTRLPSEIKQFRLSTEPFELKNKIQQYELIINDDLTCIDCAEELFEDYRYLIKVPVKPKFDLRVERVQSENSGKQGSVLIQFSSQVPSDEIRDYVTIDPEIKFSVERHYRGARLRGYFRAGQAYSINIAPGIMSKNGELMDKNYSGKILMGDLRPAVRFTTPGIFLPKKGNQLLEISTSNIDTLSIEVNQIFSNNLVTYMSSRSDLYNNLNYVYGRRTFIKDFPLEYNKNEELISTIDIASIIGDTLQGVFVISARNKSSRWISDSRNIMITDIGIMARMSEQYLLVWANSLSEAQPIQAADVKLYSRNNQLLLEGRTNKKGVVIFEDIDDEIESFQPFLIAVEKDGDLSYLRFDNSRLATSDFDVTGRPYLTDGYEAFLYTDRGVFRPGETAHLVSMIRGLNGSMPAAFPYLLKVIDPKGKIFREFRLGTDSSLTSLDIELPLDIPTGRYRATAYLSDNHILGKTDFLVEEFVPDRIKVTVNSDKSEYLSGDTINISINGQMLYGAPAANLKVTSELALKPIKFSPSGFSKFSFDTPEKTKPVKRIKLGETLLSDSGTTTFQHVIDKGHRPPGSMTAQIWATVSENGGRTVSSYIEARVHPYQRYMGLKTNLESYAKTGQPVNTDIIIVSPEGKPVLSGFVNVRFSRIVYNSMLEKQPNGRYRYVSERTLELIDTLLVSVGIDGKKISFTPADYGRYQILVQDGKNGHTASVEFYATGWGRVPWSMEEPDRIQLDLDKAQYAPGEIAILQIRSPFSGQLLLTIENQKVQDYQLIELPENTANIEIPIERKYAPNVYISATLIRPASEINKRTPARAYGLLPLKVLSEDQRLEITIENPEEIRPKSKLTLEITTNGSDQTHLTIAAVDAGIIQLTNFKTPDPFDFFYGKRRPVLEGYDLYSLVYPEIELATSSLSAPGGKSSARGKRHLNPFQARRIKVVSLWSGVINTDSTGKTSVNLDIPQFNGQLVIMAVAADNKKFGSTTSSVLVREPIILQESFPRFVAPDDRIQGLVTVYNGFDSTTNITVEASLNGQGSLLSEAKQTIKLESGKQGVVTFPFRGLFAPGLIKVTIKAYAGEEQTEVSFELANRPINPLSTIYGSGAVTLDSSAEFTIADHWVDGTAEFTLKTSSLSSLQITRNIEYLLKYPYGCVEQTTSALFPLLYFNDLAKIVRPELLGGKGHEYFIAEGIERLLRFQKSNGSFSYWPGSQSIHNWSSIYASHFLVEARLAGYDVEKSNYKKLINSLKNIARSKYYNNINTEQRVYAGLVLAKAGENDNKLFNYLSNIDTSKLPDYSVYQLATALALAGDLTTAKEMVPFDVQPDLSQPETGGNFSSGVRTNAILLDLLIEIDPLNLSTAVLAKSMLEKSRLNRWYNTQTTAFALMSLGKYFRQIEPTAFNGIIKIDGLDTISIDTSDFVLIDDNISGKNISISIDDNGPCYYYWQASGISTKSDNLEYDRGIIVRREYLDETGIPVDLSRIKLGTQLVGHITIESTDGNLQNVVIADLLPSGFEIENSRLANSPLMPWLPRKAAKHTYQDIRDDRILTFVNLPSRKTLNFYYGIRVISVGNFNIPPVSAECMYNPLKASSGSSGIVTVVE